MRIVAHQGAPKSMCICSIHHCALPGGHKELSPKESKGNSPIIWIESGIDGSNGVGLSGKKSKTISLALLDSSTTAAEEVSEEVSEVGVVSNASSMVGSSFLPMNCVIGFSGGTMSISISWEGSAAAIEIKIIIEGEISLIIYLSSKYIPELIEEVDSVETDSETVEPPTSWNFAIEILKCLTSFMSFDERRTL